MNIMSKLNNQYRKNLRKYSQINYKLKQFKDNYDRTVEITIKNESIFINNDELKFKHRYMIKCCHHLILNFESFENNN